MICNNFLEQIFLNPIRNGADEIFILSGNATPNMATLLMKKIQDERKYTVKNINLIIGMTAHRGISISNHNGFLSLHNKYFGNKVENFSCSYVCEESPIHSNLYLFMKDDTPQIAFIGSAEFIQPAFLENQRELMIRCDENIAYNIYTEADRHSIYCNHSEVDDNIVIHRDNWIDNSNNQLSVVNGASIKSVKLSLLMRNNQIGTASSLNWGQRANRNRNEAYIPVPVNVMRSGFFPCDKHFTVLTDDGHFLILRTEQEKAKAITTPSSNAQLGEYFRRRLKLSNGAFVNTNDLINYGRTDVEFFKIDDEHYYMDFSV